MTCMRYFLDNKNGYRMQVDQNLNFFKDVYDIEVNMYLSLHLYYIHSRKECKVVSLSRERDVNGNDTFHYVMYWMQM